MSSFKSIIARINRLLPEEFQTKDLSPDGLAQRLNHCARESLLDRRTFLQIAGLITSTNGLSQVLFPRSAHAMYNMGAFWRKPSSSSTSGYPANSGRDPFWDYVSLLMNMDTPLPSTGFTTVFADESNVGKATTLGGGVYIDSTTTRGSMAGSANFQSSSSSYVAIAHDSSLLFGASDFTIECFLKLSSTGSQFVSAHHNYGSNAQFYFALDSSSRIYFNAYISNVAAAVTGTTSLTTGSFYHIAVSRSAGTLKLFINGVQEASTAISGSLDNPGTQWNIGRQTNGSLYLNGWLSDYRVYNGVAKYTANFTPPTGAIGLGTVNDKYWGYCVLACPFENTLKDMSGRSMSLSSSPTLTTSTYKWGSASYDPSGGVCTTTSNNDLLDSDFTIEAWVYPSDTSGYRAVYANGTNLEFGINSGKIELYAGSLITGSGTVPINQWSHIAVARTGTALRFFLNGALDSTTTLSGSVGSSSGTIFIGGWNTGVDRFAGYIDSLRVTKGYARYLSNFAPPTAGFPVGKDETIDPFWTYTVLAMHMDDLTDATGRHAITNNNSVSLTASPNKFGTGSTSYNGSSTYLSTPSSTDFSLSTLDYTVEFWVQFASAPSGNIGFWQTDTNISSSTNTLWIGYNSSKIWMGQHATSNNVSGTWSPLANVWYHVAASRQGGMGYVFVDGVCLASGNFNYTLVEGGVIMGKVTALNYLNGSIDDLRVTKGTARYTQNFTPPTRAFATTSSATITDYDPFWSNVVALLHMDEANASFTDSSGKTPVTNNSVSYSSSSKKFGSGSGSFNGSSSYLKLPDSTDWDLASISSYTIEAWVNINSGARSSAAPICSNNNLSGGNPWAFYIDTNNKVNFYCYDTTYHTATSSAAISASTWSHVAATVSGNNINVFVDGVLSGSTTKTGTIQSQNKLVVGRANNGEQFPGYIDDFRITKGVVRYASTFTPPGRAFPNNGYGSSTFNLVTSGLVVNVDAGEVSSYGGSGQLFRNLVVSPADGSSQTTYDFYLGSSSSSESSDPTFNGIAGGRSIYDYFSFDGGDYFTQTSAQTAFTKSLHKGSLSFTVIALFQAPSAFDNTVYGARLFSTGNSQGFDFGWQKDTKTLFATFYGSDSNFYRTTDQALMAAGKYLVAFSLDATAHTAFFYVNGAYSTVSSANTFSVNFSSPSTTDASATNALIGIGGSLSGSTTLDNTSRLYNVLIYNRALSKTELDQNWGVLRARLGL